ncbi:hypothetical protein SAMN05192533_101110 [Mesobacillus persicus]|uniref:Uncharacterized protein n=1 Tax=Mesobacillus persicus TaxID=930146 RepID=A0A1H7VTL1_9BACI|nr:hypothetical protein SAMN05192533_101110 [Mesobacillus persicus]
MSVFFAPTSLSFSLVKDSIIGQTNHTKKKQQAYAHLVSTGLSQILDGAWHLPFYSIPVCKISSR